MSHDKSTGELDTEKFVESNLSLSLFAQKLSSSSSLSNWLLRHFFLLLNLNLRINKIYDYFNQHTFSSLLSMSKLLFLFLEIF